MHMLVTYFHFFQLTYNFLGISTKAKCLKNFYHVLVILAISCSVEQSVHDDSMGLFASSKLTLLHSEWPKLWSFGHFECNRVNSFPCISLNCSSAVYFEEI